MPQTKVVSALKGLSDTNELPLRLPVQVCYITHDTLWAAVQARPEDVSCYVVCATTTTYPECWCAISLPRSRAVTTTCYCLLSQTPPGTRHYCHYNQTNKPACHQHCLLNPLSLRAAKTGLTILYIFYLQKHFPENI